MKWLKHHFGKILACVSACMAVAMPKAQAQTDAWLTHYYAMPTFYNPAAVGQSDFLRLRGGMRAQWVGIDNAPTSFLVTGDMPFKFLNKKWGTGLVLQQESLGLFSNITVDAQIGFKKNLWHGVLTGALQVGVMSETFKGSKVFIPSGDDYHQVTDEAIPSTDVSGTALDLGAGLFYTHKWFWVGASVLHLTSPTIKFTGEGGSSGGGGGSMGSGSMSRQDDGGGSASDNVKEYQFQAKRNLYVMAGSNIPIKNTLFELLPSAIVSSDFTFTTFQVTGRVRYNKFLIAGLGYRYNEAISVMVGAEFKNFYLGYSYDYATGDIGKVSSGSHEVVVGYQLKLNFSEKNRNKQKSIRIM